MKIDPTTTEIIRATFNAVAERMRIAFPAAQLHVFDAGTGLRLDPA